jgi:uncharacterized protein YbjT (DUF2867 family)
VRVLVTGGTGHLGREVASALEAGGHTTRVLSRRPRPADHAGEWAPAQLESGEGVDAALADVQGIVHTASDPTRAAVADVEGTRILCKAAAHAGVAHFVFVSIIGIDKIPLGYYRQKLAAEQVIRDSGVPFSILRAAQFHHFVDLLLGGLARVRGLLPIPRRFRVQSIATADVARVLVETVAAAPSGHLRDLAGPKAMTVAQAARRWVAARRERRLVIPVPTFGATAAAFRRGYNTAPDHPAGRETWGEWLTRRYGEQGERE